MVFVFELVEDQCKLKHGVATFRGYQRTLHFRRETGDFSLDIFFYRIETILLQENDLTENNEHQHKDPSSGGLDSLT